MGATRCSFGTFLVAWSTSLNSGSSRRNLSGDRPDRDFLNRRRNQLAIPMSSGVLPVHKSINFAGLMRPANGDKPLVTRTGRAPLARGRRRRRVNKQRAPRGAGDHVRPSGLCARPRRNLFAGARPIPRRPARPVLSCPVRSRPASPAVTPVDPVAH